MSGEIKVKTGMCVEIELVNMDDQPERIVFQIVPNKQADYSHGYLGESTPLAQAILGKLAGEVIRYRVDDIKAVRILAVRPADAAHPGEAAARREAEYRKAVADADKRNAISFAASFSGKWGDYDPGGVEDWDQDQKKDEK